MDKRIEGQEAFAFCLMDIDNFKAYNDRYGYAKGNQLIKFTADTIQRVVLEYGNEDDFIGHIGGDDFVLVTSPERYAKICNKVIADFDNQISAFYNLEDNDRGYVVGENRQGEGTVFPLASISIAVVTDHENRLDNYIKVGEITAELKEYAKLQEGSVCVFDKRGVNEKTSAFKNVIEFPKKQKSVHELEICQEEAL
jgi:diguanylate cyclase (GGDEF)-like protein